MRVILENMGSVSRPPKHWRRHLHEIEVRYAEARERQRAEVFASTDAEARRLVESGFSVRLPAAPGSALLRGLVSNYRGRMAEARVVRLLNRPALRPAWLLEARSATPEEDVTGIDVVVSTTDAGCLSLQVKSCTEAAQAFLRKRPHLVATVGVIVAPVEAADLLVWAAAVGQLLLLRLRRTFP